MQNKNVFYTLLNTSINEAVSRVVENKTQRLSLDLQCSSHLEILITPLDNDWDKTRLVGTDENYICISVVDYGCYAFSINTRADVGYVSTKLGLPYDVADCLTIFINDFLINLTDKKYG